MVLGFTLDGVGIAVAITGGLLLASAVGYGTRSLISNDNGNETADDVALRETVAGIDRLALVVPESPSIDALAAAVGLQAICNEWGVASQLFAEGSITGEDSKTFCNIFDLEPELVTDAGDTLTDCDGSIAVGGGGAIPYLSNNPPVLAVIRHRPAADENVLTITRTDDGSTSTTVTDLLEESGTVPDQRVATALLYGIRAGTSEFRRANSESDYDAAGYLHTYADLGRIEDLRTSGMSGDTFDVIGNAIANRQRRASFAIANVGPVPAVSALEEAADTLLRLEGVSTAAVFGIHEETIVVSCRAEDMRTNALSIVENAFDSDVTTGGNADAATARVSLGLFSQVDGDHKQTLDDLINASTQKALFTAFESS